MTDDGYTRIEKTIQPKWAVGNHELEDYLVPFGIAVATYVIDAVFNLPLGFIGLLLFIAWKSLEFVQQMKKGKLRSVKQHYKYKFGMVKTQLIPGSHEKEFNGT